MWAVRYRVHPYDPFWGQQTSNSNFCEEDYIISPYIGEFVNTLTNSVYCFYAITRLLNHIRQPRTHTRRITYYSLAFVGIASASFHGLLKYHSQMMDDLSMLVATSSVLYQLLTLDKSRTECIKIGAAIAAIVGSLFFYHAATDEIIVHQITFAAMITYIVHICRRLTPVRIKRQQDIRNIQNLTLIGATFFIFGYILWQIDHIYCQQLTQLRRHVGIPWGFVFEFHGWWHVFTAIAAYMFMALVEILTANADKGPKSTSKDSGRWDGAFIWPASVYLNKIRDGPA